MPRPPRRQGSHPENPRTPTTPPAPEARAGDLGAQGLTTDDRAYRGSTYGEVREALFANPYQSVWGAEGEPPLPVYPVTWSSVARGLLPFGRRFRFLQAARRTVRSAADLRWGPDGRGFRRLLHPNGVCLLGRWEITEPTEYSGFFRSGSRALAVCRYSTCCTETRRGHTRSLSMVGKLWPTEDLEHAEPLETASFITQQDLGGERTEFINDAEIRNAPDTHAWRRGAGLPVFLLTGATFLFADREPAERQLYEIAELGKAADEPTRTPRFLRFLVAREQPRIHEIGGRIGSARESAREPLDFRDEVLAQIYDPGDPEPRRRLVFEIEVADRGTTRGPAFWQTRSIEGWRRIGRLVLHEAVASYNGDFVIHFPHPPWRKDRDDPETLARPSHRPLPPATGEGVGDGEGDEP